ncbi:phosphatidylinositol-glycan biosynthesis class S protein-domain-containing protein [Mycena rosella]|uniref:Phosphatidylinositol-glycan biosynthesis class S protein-domain-containing protein n=1 Tax=Mycena rosella TaxID=1033263 RepID=A0AAD7CV07_MYCRO|nr:phosphatidylinositol-glycan biosynthesis class S protein-domain-containing protein [Mycena rosella]
MIQDVVERRGLNEKCKRACQTQPCQTSPCHQHAHPERTTLRDPSRLFYQTDYNRRLIIASYWVVIIFSIPLWWYTTSIQRLSLPASRVHSHAGNQLRFPLQITLENAQDASLSASLQQLIHDRMRRSPQAWKGLDVRVRNHDEADELVDSYTIKPDDDIPLASQRQLTYPVRSGTLPMLADTLSLLLVPPADAHRVAQYSPRYQLAFTLLNEDAAAGRAISSWDISGALSRHLSPILDSLSVLHNFTIESQVQFHAPLAFSTTSLHNGYGLTPEDLTVFVNSAEWSLSSSVSNDPVLHFILFVPSASRRPLQILDAEGQPSSSDAFLLPQWGGIVIYNPPADLQSHTQLPSSALHSVFSTFAGQLLALLGVPSLPPDLRTDASVLTGWQLDALLRRRALENAENTQDTLESIIKLVDQIENMPVGQDVKGDVQHSLTALDQMYASASTSLNETLHQSADALTLASRAFFNPGMLALLYFPAEHKYAVYTPLFASAVIPLMAAAAREFMAWRRQRREAVAE